MSSIIDIGNIKTFTKYLHHPFFSACQVCTPNATNTVWSNCQCVLADGVERGILTANRMLPGPSVQVCENDKVVIDVENHMEGMEVTIHWHGVWQRGSQYYDGVPFVTQCPIQQGNTFRYVVSIDCELGLIISSASKLCTNLPRLSLTDTNG